MTDQLPIRMIANWVTDAEADLDAPGMHDVSLDLRAERVLALAAEVERLRTALADAEEDRDHWEAEYDDACGRFDALTARAEQAEATLAKVAALAEEWAEVVVPGRLVHDDVFREHAGDLRALIGGDR